MTLLLADAAALVTGGGSGIGRASAIAMAREGARVAVADRSLDAARSTVAAILAAGGEAIAIRADVASAPEVAAMLADTLAAFGRLDCALNNAGIGSAEAGGGLALGDIPDDVWHRVLAVNLGGVRNCMTAELAPMLRQGGGAIVNVASVLGLGGMRHAAAYIAAKHAVVGLTRSAALDYAAAGIRINAICPGTIRTGITADAIARRGADIAAGIPLGRVGEAEEIAESVVFLCSPRTAFATATLLTVDGGLTL